MIIYKTTELITSKICIIVLTSECVGWEMGRRLLTKLAGSSMLHMQSGGQRKETNHCLSYFSIAVVMTKATYRGRVYLEFMIPKCVKALI